VAVVLAKFLGRTCWLGWKGIVDEIGLKISIVVRTRASAMNKLCLVTSLNTQGPQGFLHERHQVMVGKRCLAFHDSLPPEKKSSAVECLETPVGKQT